MLDRQHRRQRFFASSVEHKYGDNVHIVADPVSLSQLARLCTPEAVQPEINFLVQELYSRMIVRVINAEFPTRRTKLNSRMREVLENNGQESERGVIEGEFIDRSTPVVSVDIARAGILPSLTCYNVLNQILDPRQVRQDHLIVSRATDKNEQVTGAQIKGEKIGGPIDGRIVIFPDPMGATGSSLSTAIKYYKESFGGQPLKLITLNLIFTPEYIRRIKDDHPEVIMYALRLDRGMSASDVLDTVPGTRWDEERGLDEHQYIVPGGGGFGEIMNNAWV